MLPAVPDTEMIEDSSCPQRIDDTVIESVCTLIIMIFV